MRYLVIACLLALAGCGRGVYNAGYAAEGYAMMAEPGAAYALAPLLWQTQQRGYDYNYNLNNMLLMQRLIEMPYR